MTKLYFAGAEGGFSAGYTHQLELQETFLNLNVKHILFSYFYINKKAKILDVGDRCKVFLDCGAFGAKNSGKEIDIHQYIQFIKENKKNIHVYASLDVIGNPEASYKNHQIIKKEGLNPIPTFHVGSDIKWLRKYINDGERYIALGGMVPYALKPMFLRKWLKKCFDNIPDTIKVHGFGMSNPRLMKAYPFYSVDSTSWLAGEKYGNFYFYERGTIKQVNINKKVQRGTKDYVKVTKWNLTQWNKFADYMEERYGNKDD